MIYLQDDKIIISFPELHPNASLSIDLQRTLRLPDDGNTHALPPGFGSFPLRHIADYDLSENEMLKRRGGLIMPMFQADALWLNFNTINSDSDSEPYPMAVKIGTGKRCALTGEPWSSHLNQDPQDYVVTPDQRWLDGYNMGNGEIRQFVAAPLGEGITAEEQLSGRGDVGGIQIQVFPMKKAHYLDMINIAQEPRVQMFFQKSLSFDMGLAAGGKMNQEIYEDENDFSAWDQRQSERCFITIANAQQWQGITGEEPPMRAMNAEDYTKAGLPWFHHSDENKATLSGTDVLSALKSFHQAKAESGDSTWIKESVTSKKAIVPTNKRPVAIGEW